jgi:hypothetical protein
LVAQAAQHGPERDAKKIRICHSKIRGVEYMKTFLRVIEVQPGSQAEKLGIKPDDLLISYNGSTLSRREDLHEAIGRSAAAGRDENEIVLRRGSDERSVNATTEQLGLTFHEEAAQNRTGAGAYGLESAHASDYQTAKAISRLVSGVGWAAVAIGILGAAVALQQAGNAGGLALFAVLPALIMSALGLLMVLAGQVTRAAVDTADNSREILRSVERWQKESKARAAAELGTKHAGNME